MTDAQAAPFRVCPFCCCPISVGESSIWVHGVECHSTCFPPRPADPAWGQPSLLTEDDVRRIVREELANEQEWIPVKGLANDAADEIERLTAERERLRELECAVSNALPGSYYMDPPDGGDVPLGEQVRRMALDARRYRWLRGDSCPNHSSRWTQWEVRCWKAPSWTGDLRRADLDDAIDAARGKE